MPFHFLRIPDGDITLAGYVPICWRVDVLQCTLDEVVELRGCSPFLPEVVKGRNERGGWCGGEAEIDFIAPARTASDLWRHLFTRFDLQDPGACLPLPAIVFGCLKLSKPRTLGGRARHYPARAFD
jgi:hypothetical protein